MKRKFHDVDQSDESWLELRRGFITSSNYPKIMANAPGKFGNPAMEYCMRIALEGKTNRSVETYTNSWMERGLELEADARHMYSDLTFTDVINGGFMEMGRFGSSSDGLVEADGMIEIKCQKFNVHFEQLRKGGINSAYKWQLIGQLYIYDRQWVDFLSYCPDFPHNKQLYIFRVERDLDKENQMIERLNQFTKEVDMYINILEQ